MTILLVGVAAYTILGVMLSVLVTDYLQFIVMSAGLLVVTFLVLVNVGWTTLADTVASRYGAGGFNPFVNPELGFWYVAFNLVAQFAVVLTWQTTIARVLSAKDTKTGTQVYTRTAFFFVARFVIPGLWGIAALATLAPAVIGDNDLHAMPIFLAGILPVGLLGIVVAAMLAADMSTDSSYMLTWGGVIYNDIMAPFRRTKWTEKKGILINRMIVALIGVFLLFYGLWYPLQGDLWSYLLVTGSIYLSSMSVLLIACCYWRRANSWGAAAAIAVGAIIPILSLVLEQLPATAEWATAVGRNRFGIAAYAGTAIAMVVGSLLKPVLRR
jgi:SSS family solute:Na+ symporter